MEASRRLAAVAFALACTMASPLAASASFVGLLKGSPAELFDDADLHMFLNAARQALDAGAENQPIAWQNPKTTHRGDMTIVKRFESKGRNCARLRVHNEADLRKSTMHHNLCVINGTWRLVGDVKSGEAK